MTDLRDGNHLSIGTPSGLLQELGYLCCLARACLANDNDDGKGLDEIQKALLVFGDWKKRRRLVQRRNEGCRQVKICHDYPDSQARGLWMPAKASVPSRPLKNKKKTNCRSFRQPPQGIFAALSWCKVWMLDTMPNLRYMRSILPYTVRRPKTINAPLLPTFSRVDRVQRCYRC